MRTIPAKITERLEEEMEEIIKEGWYANKSEFIRDAIRQMIRKLNAEKLEKAIKEDIEWGLRGE
ncbi:MAG: hypothetical protein J7J87_04585 [Candidatus Diapherotrites archaeon]|nr:hypothetical protein [Candidatus Diapherotrites archaeon]